MNNIEIWVWPVGRPSSGGPTILLSKTIYKELQRGWVDERLKDLILFQRLKDLILSQSQRLKDLILYEDLKRGR